MEIKIIEKAEIIRERKHKHLVICGSLFIIVSILFSEHFSTIHNAEIFGVLLLMVADL